MIREAVQSEIPTPAVRPEEDEERYRRGETLRTAETEESSTLLSENWSGDNISVLRCRAGRAQSESRLARHTWRTVAPSMPPPSVSFSPCQAHDDGNDKKEEETGALGSAARGTDLCSAGIKSSHPARRSSPHAYLVVVVIGQTLAVESHPPPLKNTVSAKTRDADSVHWAPSPQQSGAKINPSKKQTVGLNFPAQVLIFHQEFH